MKLEDVDEAPASWMKLEMVCIQLCQGAVSVGCTDKPYIVDSVPDHMVVVAFQKLAAFIPVVVQEPSGALYRRVPYCLFSLKQKNSIRSAKPKSPSLIKPFAEMNRLSGLMSYPFIPTYSALRDE